MTFAALLGLAGLALVDSTSFGTLVLPLLMLVQPQVRAGRVLLYLATITAFYWALGFALLLGAQRLVLVWSDLDDSRALDWVQLVVGVGLLVGSFWPDTPWGRARARARAAETASGVPKGWRGKVLGPEARPATVIGVALGAGLVEAASMLPYLGAIGLISTSELSPTGRVLALTGYVVLMGVPALGLLWVRLALHDRVEARLRALASRLTRHTGTALWWVIGILGFLLATDAVRRLGLWGS